MNGARFVHDTLELAGWRWRSPTPRRSKGLPVSDLLGTAGRDLLERLEVPEPGPSPLPSS